MPNTINTKSFIIFLALFIYLSPLLGQSVCFKSQKEIPDFSALGYIQSIASLTDGRIDGRLTYIGYYDPSEKGWYYFIGTESIFFPEFKKSVFEENGKIIITERSGKYKVKSITYRSNNSGYLDGDIYLYINDKITCKRQIFYQ